VSWKTGNYSKTNGNLNFAHVKGVGFSFSFGLSGIPVPPRLELAKCPTLIFYTNTDSGHWGKKQTTTMKKMFLILTASVVLFSSCATVFSGSRQTVSIQSDPPDAKVYVKGEAIGVTPLTTKLKRRTKVIELKKDGYETTMKELKRGINGWYWLDCGLGIIGAGLIYIIVDLADGACYTLPPSVLVEMKKK
jgi:hypothetical protein